MKLKMGALALAILGGAGWFVTEEVRATVQEHDLSKLGNGVATVVQVHDPQCPKCVALQRETRDALDSFADDELQLLVANIRTDEGRAFARKHRVAHVTLILFDGKGERRHTLTGPNSAENLEPVFRRLLRQNKDG